MMEFLKQSGLQKKEVDMEIEKDKILTKIVDKQFEILGVKMKFSDIPESGLVDGKKWYNVYKFTEEQELKWKEWALKELEEECDEKQAKEIFRELDMIYGFIRRYPKKGELF